jgi:hypothetical protein
VFAIVAGGVGAAILTIQGEVAQAVVVGVGSVLYAFPLLVVTVLLRLFAGVSIAVREIALNTRRTYSVASRMMEPVSSRHTLHGVTRATPQRCPECGTLSNGM